MDIQRILFLREVVVTDGNGKTTIALEFSLDSGADRTPRFFGVPDDDLPQARLLNQQWGGSRPEGYRVGSTVPRP